MNRDDKIKAASAGLQPKSLDLTDFAPARVASRVRSTLRVANDEAGYILGFAAGAIADRDGDMVAGDPLAVALLRLKYAGQLRIGNFETALALLLHRHGGLARPASDTLRAVAAAALVEWLNDRCPKCRGPREAALQPGRCSECAPAEQGGRFFRTDGEPITALRDRQGEVIRTGTRASTAPRPGCPKCKGMGRIFREPETSRGMACVHCRNSGLVSWKSKQRWRMVSELIAEDRRARGLPVLGFGYDAFMEHWHRRYYGFIDVLRAADRRMGATIDLGWRAGDRTAMEAVDTEDETMCTRAQVGSEQEHNDATLGGSPTAATEEKAEGEVPPQET